MQFEQFKNWFWNEKEQNILETLSKQSNSQSDVQSVFDNDDEAHNFNVGIKELKLYATRYDDLWINKSYVSESNFKLGKFVSEVKKSINNMTLTEHRHAKLKNIKGWETDNRKLKFKAGINRLNEYISLYGNSSVEVSHITKDGFDLGKWVYAIRYQYRLKKLKPYQISILDSISGWSWKNNSQKVKKAKKVFDKINTFEDITLKEQVPKLNNNSMPRKVDELILIRKVDELELSSRLAVYFNNENIIYIGDLIQKSESVILRASNIGRKSLNEIKEALALWALNLGMDVLNWPLENIDEYIKKYEKQKFNRGISLLKVYINDNGNSSLDYNYIISDGTEEFKLGVWVYRLRVSYKNWKLDQMYITQLEAIDGWTWKF